MPAVNTYHTLNEYRVSTESEYESGPQTKLTAAAVVIAIFLGIGAYFYYSTPHRSENANPAAIDTNYQAPVAAESAAPADALNSAAISGEVDTTTTPVASAAATSPQDSALNRTTTDSKPSASPTQPAKRTTQPVKSSSKPTTNATTLAPELNAPAPTIAPQPASVDQAPQASTEPSETQSAAPVETASSHEVEGAGG